MACYCWCQCDNKLAHSLCADCGVGRHAGSRAAGKVRLAAALPKTSHKLVKR